MNRFEVQKDITMPVDPDRIKPKQFIGTSLEYRGEVVEQDFILVVSEIRGKGSERIFTLQDMVGRTYDIDCASLSKGRAGAIVFKEVYPKGTICSVNSGHGIIR